MESKWWLFFLFFTMANSHFAEEEEKNQIFSEETRISAYTNTFDCQGKSDGYYTLVEEDCLVYHKCVSQSDFSSRLRSTHLCPLGTRFQMSTKSCQAWHEVECKDDFQSLSDSENESFNHRHHKSRRSTVSKREARYQATQQINNIPYNCFWCCKPQVEQQTWQKPTTTTRRPWRPSTTTRRPWTQTTTRKPSWNRPTTTPFWWYPTTTRKPTTTTPYWWYPASTTQRPAYRPEVIEVKQNEILDSYHPAASEVLLKFTRWKGPIVEKYPPKEDFVIIEDPLKPQIIEALV